MSSKNFKEKQMEEMIDSFKLLPTAKPPLFHYHTVRGNVSAYLWQKKIRPVVLEQLHKTCSICGWQPTIKAEERKLHLHEIEEYDYEHMVCHLIDIQLICAKCHAIQHIMRTQSVLTVKQWDDLMQHFVTVNGCSSDVLNDWEFIVTKSMQRDKNLMTMPTLAERKELTKKTRRYTVASHIPFAEEMTKQLSQKGLLHHESFAEEVIEDKEVTNS